MIQNVSTIANYPLSQDSKQFSLDKYVDILRKWNLVKIWDAGCRLNRKWQQQVYWQRLKWSFRAAIMDGEVAEMGRYVAVGATCLSFAFYPISMWGLSHISWRINQNSVNSFTCQIHSMYRIFHYEYMIDVLFLLL